MSTVRVTIYPELPKVSCEHDAPCCEKVAYTFYDVPQEAYDAIRREAKLETYRYLAQKATPHTRSYIDFFRERYEITGKELK